MAARAQRREYMQLLADCQRVYCEARLSLVAEVVAVRMAEYAREALPSLTRSGCSYLMQVGLRSLLLSCGIHCNMCSGFAGRSSASLSSHTDR